MVYLLLLLLLLVVVVVIAVVVTMANVFHLYPSYSNMQIALSIPLNCLEEFQITRNKQNIDI